MYENLNNDELLALYKEKTSNALRRDLYQNALKTLMNSMYGATANSYFLFYDIRLAKAVTKTGNAVIKSADKAVNKFLNERLNTNLDYMVAGDTDSGYFSLENIIKSHKASNPNITETEIIDFMDKISNDVIQPVLKDCFQDLYEYTNSYENHMVMKRECLSTVGIWTGKKHYAIVVHDKEGVRYEKPKTKIVGLEVIKSTTPKGLKQYLRESLNIMLTKSENELIKYFSDVQEKYKSLSITDISFSKGCNDIEKYAIKSVDTALMFQCALGTPVQVRAAITYNNFVYKNNLTRKYPYIRSGDKLKYVYLKKENPMYETVFGFISKPPIEFEIEKYIDYDLMFEKSFISQIKSLTDAIKWKYEKQENVMDWF